MGKKIMGRFSLTHDYLQLEKLKRIAVIEGKKTNGIINPMIDNFIKEYENINGKINIDILNN